MPPVPQQSVKYKHDVGGAVLGPVLAVEDAQPLDVVAPGLGDGQGDTHDRLLGACRHAAHPTAAGPQATETAAPLIAEA